jgi:hypothetical protein
LASCRQRRQTPSTPDRYGDTLARHATEPIAGDVNERRLRDRCRPRDPLPGGIGTVTGADGALHETIDRVMLGPGLAHLPALDR